MASESEASFLPFYIQCPIYSTTFLLFRHLDNSYHDNTKCKVVENLLRLSDVFTKDRRYLVLITIYAVCMLQMIPNRKCAINLRVRVEMSSKSSLPDAIHIISIPDFV